MYPIICITLYSTWQNYTSRFLEALTGIAALIPDPQFRGSGLHFVGPGGRLAVHADFARYEQRAAAQV